MSHPRVLLALLLVGCGAPAARPLRATGRVSGDACIESLEARLRPLFFSSTIGFHQPPCVPNATRSHPPDGAVGAVLEVADGRWSVDAEAVADVEAVTERLRSLDAIRRQMGHADPSLVYVLAEGAERIGALRAILDVVAQEHVVRLVVTPVEHEPIGSERCPGSADESWMSEGIGACPALRSLFEADRETVRASWAPLFAEDLASCECAGLDVDAIVEGLAARYGPPQHWVRWERVASARADQTLEAALAE